MFKMHIPTVIPYMEGWQIGKAYNRAVEQYADDWIIFIDYDVQILNPYWHEVCKQAIEKAGRQAGLFTCYTNRIGCKLQHYNKVDQNNHDILYHRKIARMLYDTRRGRIKDLTNAKGRFSGFFIMTRKHVWRKVGGFKVNSFFHVDVDYFDKVKKAGFKCILIESLYCYHSYLREKLHPYFEKLDT